MKLLRNCTKCRIFDYDYFDDDLKVRDYCHIIENVEALHLVISISILN